MVIIYNLSGLLVGLAGMAAGLLLFGVSGWLSAALFGLGAVWLAFGRGKRDPSTGVKRPAPSLFFIPLFIPAIPILLLAPLVVVFDVQRMGKVADPRYAQFRLDEKALNESKVNGDSALAGAVYDALVNEAHDNAAHVYASAKDDRVLVLAKVPTLKEISKAGRGGLLKALGLALGQADASKGRQVYLGIKGRVAYGIVQTPTGLTIDSVVSPDPLLNFYGPPPAEKAKPGT